MKSFDAGAYLKLKTDILKIKRKIDKHNAAISKLKEKYIKEHSPYQARDKVRYEGCYPEFCGAIGKIRKVLLDIDLFDPEHALPAFSYVVEMPPNLFDEFTPPGQNTIISVISPVNELILVEKGSKE